MSSRVLTFRELHLELVQIKRQACTAAWCSRQLSFALTQSQTGYALATAGASGG